MSKLLQKIASEKLVPGGGEHATTGKRKRGNATEDTEITVTSKAKLDNSLRPVSTGKGDKKKGRKAKDTSESSIVYLGHIPRGFEEEEIEGFFSQFGEVKRIKVFRNVKTNNIRGYAFIQFETPEVAEVAAEAIDGYFLNDRKLVCHIIPPEKIHRGMFARPELTMVDEELLQLLQEADEEDTEDEKEPLTVGNAQRQLQNRLKQMQKKQDKLKSLGYDFDFPTPAIDFTEISSLKSSKKRPRTEEPVAPPTSAAPVAPAPTSTKKKQKMEEAPVAPPTPATPAPTSTKKKQREIEAGIPVAAPVQAQKAMSRIPKAKK